MKSKIFALSLLFLLFGCSTKEIEHRADSAFVALSDNKAYGFSKLGRVIPPNKYGFFMDGYIVTTPIIKKHDFDYKNGWIVLGNDGDEDLILSLDDGHGGGYHISFNINDIKGMNNKDSYAKDILNGNTDYVINKLKKSNKNSKVNLVHIGKGQYKCLHFYQQKSDSVYNRYRDSYTCYKMGKDRKRYRTVDIVLTYSTWTHDKHPDPYFSFNDLLYRTKPMLDSLYIKDF